jgi:hypothetical protein
MKSPLFTVNYLANNFLKILTSKCQLVVLSYLTLRSKDRYFKFRKYWYYGVLKIVVMNINLSTLTIYNDNKQ